MFASILSTPAIRRRYVLARRKHLLHSYVANSKRSLEERPVPKMEEVVDHTGRGDWRALMCSSFIKGQTHTSAAACARHGFCFSHDELTREKESERLGSACCCCLATCLVASQCKKAKA